MKIDTSIQNSYTQLSSAKRINSAADDPAGLAISQKMISQVKGYDKGTDNALAARDLTRTAEDSLSSISDSLQRIRELAVQASNGTYSASDKQMAQDEINQLKTSINDTARNTEFNTLKVLDGSFSNKTLATSPSGTGQTMSIENSSLESLGIDQFDVTQPFDIADIDKAISQVNDSRSKLGATSNRLDSTVNSNTVASTSITRSEDQISGADMAKTLMDLKTQQIKQQMQIYSQKNMASQMGNTLNLLT